jgi:hypothetical protein
VLATGAQGGYYAIATWLPTYLRTERKLTVLGTGGYLAVVIVGSFIGYLVSAPKLRTQHCIGSNKHIDRG